MDMTEHCTLVCVCVCVYVCEREKGERDEKTTARNSWNVHYPMLVPWKGSYDKPRQCVKK